MAQKKNPIFEENEPIPVYDTSGPYGDPTSQLDVNLGLKKIRQPWIDARNDTEPLSHLSSDFTQQRLTDAGLNIYAFR
ncbi:hypothetical protein ACU42Y_21295 [Proteus mirabilis]